MNRNQKLVVWGSGGVVVAVATGIILAAIGWRTSVDDTWMAMMVSLRTDALTHVALALDWLGGGYMATFVIPIALIIVLVLLKRYWGAVAFAVALLASVGIVQVLKPIFGRARPEDMIVVSDFGSFPSGHTANAATLAIVLFLLLRKRWVLVAGLAWVLLMALSRTYVGAHWLSDTVAGAVLGAGVAAIVVVAFSRLLKDSPADS